MNLLLLCAIVICIATNLAQTSSACVSHHRLNPLLRHQLHALRRKTENDSKEGVYHHKTTIRSSCALSLQPSTALQKPSFDIFDFKKYASDAYPPDASSSASACEETVLQGLCDCKLVRFNDTTGKLSRLSDDIVLEASRYGLLNLSVESIHSFKLGVNSWKYDESTGAAREEEAKVTLPAFALLPDARFFIKNHDKTIKLNIVPDRLVFQAARLYLSSYSVEQIKVLKMAIDIYRFLHVRPRV